MPNIPNAAANSSTIQKCRSCGAKEIHVFLDLGRTPLANALLHEHQLSLDEPFYSLTTAFCGSCTLVQITETIKPQLLFSEYLYASSYSETMLRHAERLCID